MYEQEKCKFAKTHEWAFIEGETAVVGISDHAQHEISDIVFVELPQKGAQVKAGARCCVIESVKSASDIFSTIVVIIGIAIGGEVDHFWISRLAQIQHIIGCRHC